MKKILAKIILTLLTVIMLCPAIKTEAKAMKVSIYKVSGNTVYYRKAKLFYDLIDGEICNVLGDHGYGKTHKIKVTKKTKYYLFDYAHGNTAKTTKKNFKKLVKKWVGYRGGHLYTRSRKRTKIYPGYICKMTYSGKKAKKFVEIFQS